MNFVKGFQVIIFVLCKYSFSFSLVVNVAALNEFFHIYERDDIITYAYQRRQLCSMLRNKCKIYKKILIVNFEKIAYTLAQSNHLM